MATTKTTKKQPLTISEKNEILAQWSLKDTIALVFECEMRKRANGSNPTTTTKVVEKKAKATTKVAKATTKASAKAPAKKAPAKVAKATSSTSHFSFNKIILLDNPNNLTTLFTKGKEKWGLDNETMRKITSFLGHKPNSMLNGYLAYKKQNGCDKNELAFISAYIKLRETCYASYKALDSATTDENDITMVV